MACHEIAALRLGLMNVLGVQDEAMRAHELAELGAMSEELGPLQSLSRATNLRQLERFFDAALSTLEERVARCPSDDPKLPYYRSLLILTKQTELSLALHRSQLLRLFEDLEKMHDFVHEIYPVEG